jgi:thymidylate synthase
MKFKETDLHESGRPLTKEEFINKIKTDEEFAKRFGDLGKIYGHQWRNWNHSVDQISDLIKQLKDNPDSRRLLVSAWNISDLPHQVLPPCHYGFQVYTRELSWEERFSIHKKYITEDKLDLLFEFATNENLDALGVPTRAISLMWNQRSVDTFLGLPFNIASYGLLLEIIAKEVNMVPDELIGNLGDVHLYNNHIEQAKEQIGRELSLEERIELASKDPVFDPGDFGVGEQVTDEHCHEICDSYSVTRKTRELTLEERRAMVSQDEFNKVYTGGSPETLSHSEIDQFGVPRRTREPFGLPKLVMDYREGEYSKNLKDFVPDDFYLIDYQSHPTIKAPLSN